MLLFLTQQQTHIILIFLKLEAQMWPVKWLENTITFTLEKIKTYNELILTLILRIIHKFLPIEIK